MHRIRTRISKIGIVAFSSVAIVALSAAVAFAVPSNPVPSNPNGAGNQRPVFFDGQLVTVNMFEVPAADGSVLDKNANVNTIYASNDLDDEQDFFSVINAIQGDSFNPLWHQVLIEFNPGVTPHQFTSEDEVLAAAAAGEITLMPTDEVYRCSIVGSK